VRACVRACVRVCVLSLSYSDLFHIKPLFKLSNL